MEIGTHQALDFEQPHLEDWVSYKTKVEPILYEMIQQTRKSHLSASVSKLYLEVFT